MRNWTSTSTLLAVVGLCCFSGSGSSAEPAYQRFDSSAEPLDLDERQAEIWRYSLLMDFGNEVLPPEPEDLVERLKRALKEAPPPVQAQSPAPEMKRGFLREHGVAVSLVTGILSLSLISLLFYRLLKRRHR